MGIHNIKAGWRIEDFPGIFLHHLLVLQVCVDRLIRAFLLCVQEVRWRGTKDGYLIHHVCCPLCLLIGYPLLTQSQLPMKHCQMIFPISMRQFTGQRHILRTPLITL